MNEQFRDEGMDKRIDAKLLSSKKLNSIPFLPKPNAQECLCKLCLCSLYVNAVNQVTIVTLKSE